MVALVRWLVLGTVVVGSFGTAVRGMSAVPLVRDEGKFFSAEAIQKANDKVKQIARDFKIDLAIETFSGVPANLEPEYRKAEGNDAKARFIRAWAVRRAEQEALHGIYVMIVRDPTKLEVLVGERTRQRAFTLSDRDELVKKMVPLLRAKKNDEALLETVRFVEATLKSHLGHRAASGVNAPAPHAAADGDRNGGISTLGWIAIAIGIVVLLWIVFGLVRALTGFGRGAYGGAGGPGGSYGPGGNGPGAYGGGFGGGGFMTSLLGGLFGAAAGHWLYDSFFRGGSSHWGESTAYGGTSPSPSGYAGDTGPESFGGDAGGGADYGNNDSGGGFAEDSGGGADWGDTGGDGDFGGGDFGDG
jgi:uncharacterized protein